MIGFLKEQKVGPHSFHRLISNLITGTDRRARTVLSLMRPYNTRCAVKYPFFAQILTLCRAIKSTNPIRQFYSSGYSAYSCLIGLVDLIARLSAMILAKSLIVSNKNYCNQRAPIQ
jgi:hypothetical protein